METTKKTLEIREVLEKIGKNEKPYWVVVTPEGGITCFDTKIVEELQKNTGKKAIVTIKASNGFKNLRELHGFDGNLEVKEETVKPTKEIAPNLRQIKSFLIGYGRDLSINIAQVEQHLDIKRDNEYWKEKARQGVLQLEVLTKGIEKMIKEGGA